MNDNMSSDDNSSQEDQQFTQKKGTVRFNRNTAKQSQAPNGNLQDFFDEKPISQKNRGTCRSMGTDSNIFNEEELLRRREEQIQLFTEMQKMQESDSKHHSVENVRTNFQNQSLQSSSSRNVSRVIQNIDTSNINSQGNFEVENKTKLRKRKIKMQRTNKHDEFGQSDDSIEPYNKTENLRYRQPSKRQMKSSTAASSKMPSSFDQEMGQDSLEIDKYQKEQISQELKKNEEFKKGDVQMLKIINGVVIVLSCINLCFHLAINQFYRLNVVNSDLFPISTAVALVVSIFGQIAIIRVEQKSQKYYFSEMSGTFSFEALMVYFRIVIIMTPIMFYLAVSSLIASSVLSVQLEGIYRQDEQKHSRWIQMFGRELQLQPLQESCIFVACILSFSTFIIAIFQLILVNKAIKICGEQAKNRLNDLFQIMACIVNPGLCVTIACIIIIQIWYNQPYEGIFDALFPLSFCKIILYLLASFFILQLLGMKGGNCESNLFINVYMFASFIFAVLLMTQWSFILNQYQQFQQDMYSDPLEVANLMTYVHFSDFKFLIGGVGLMSPETYMSCPSGKYKDHLSSSNLYELKCPNRNLIRMKWDLERSDLVSNENLYACLNVECQEQFKAWIDQRIFNYLLLTLLLIVSCLFSIHLAYLMKSFFREGQNVMWQDDTSIGITIMAICAILVGGILFLQTHSFALQARTLKRFDYFQEFDKYNVQQRSSKFQLLKQETMRIDNKLMVLDQSKFEILALQINEDDSLCRPDCVPLVFNVTISSIHGNVYINIPNVDNRHSYHSSLFINETRNELNMNFIKFSGNIIDVNEALRSLTFEPLCPFDSDNIIQLKVTAEAENGMEGSSQLVSMAIGQYKEMKGKGPVEIVDMPIYQHLSRNKNTLVIGKVIDSVNLNPIHNVTVSAIMTGYQCETKQMQVDENGIFKIEYTHLRNNYPYTVQLKVNSNDNGFQDIKRDVIIGGILRPPFVYIELPMTQSQNVQQFLTYQTYVVDSQQLQLLKQEDVTVYIQKMAPQETSNVVTVFPDQSGLVTLPHQKLSPQFVKTIVQPSQTNFLKYQSIDFMHATQMTRPMVLQPTSSQSDMTIVLTWITAMNSNQLNIELDLFVDFMVDEKFKCSVSTYLPVCKGTALNTKPKCDTVKKLGVQVININNLDQFNYLIYVGQYMDQRHLLSRKDIQDSYARIDIYSNNRQSQSGKMKSDRKEGSSQIASIDIPFAQLVAHQAPVTSNGGSPQEVKFQTGQILEHSKAMYWSALCINGRTTLNDIYTINELTHQRPDVSKVCKSELSKVMKKID